MEENVTEFNWNAGKTFDLGGTKAKVKYSNNFTLKNDPVAEFALFIDGSEGYINLLKKGIAAMQIGENKPIVMRIQHWINDESGNKLYEHTVEKFAFDEAGQKYEFGTTPGEEVKFLDNVYSNKSNISFGCKLTVLDVGFFLCAPNFKDALVQKLRNAYENETGFDSTIVADGKEFKISRFVLCAHSEVFYAMFSGEFKETLTGKIQIKGVSAQAMEAFVKWMYTGELTNMDIIEDLFVLADKYMIEDLKVVCADLMANNLDEDNTAQRLVLAAKHNDKDLERKITGFIVGKGAVFMHKIYRSKVWFDYMKLQNDTET